MALGANVAYSLASIPLVLSYITNEEFGLWTVVVTVGGYLMLLDIGTGTSIARLLIDHKDQRTEGGYGSMIKAGLVVGALQGVVVLMAGFSLAWILPAWLGIELGLSREFFWLICIQALLTCATFAGRIFTQILHAWQRLDVSNSAQCAGVLTGFGMLWIGLASGWGVFSLLAANAMNFVTALMINVAACRRLALLPRGHAWGQPAQRQFREILGFGLDVFLIAVGTQMFYSSQALLVTAAIGLDAAAVWGVATRSFLLVCEIVWRPWMTSMPAFGEMYRRGEMAALWSRYRSVFGFSSAIAVAAGVLFAMFNSRFVELWSGGRIAWAEQNNWLLGLWLVLLTQCGCHNSLLIAFKQIRRLKFVYLLEGVVFLGSAWLALPRWGFSGMLVASVVCTAALTLAYGTTRVGRLSGLGCRGVAVTWQVRPAILGVLLVASSCILHPLLATLPGWPGLIIGSLVAGAVAAALVVLVGLPPELLREVSRRGLSGLRTRG